MCVGGTKKLISVFSYGEGIGITFSENNSAADGWYDPYMHTFTKKALALLKAQDMTLRAGMRFATAGRYLTSIDRANMGAFGEPSPGTFESYLRLAGEAAKELGIDFTDRARDLVERYLENALTNMEGLMKEFGRPKSFYSNPPWERIDRHRESGEFCGDLREYVSHLGVLKVADELQLYAERYGLLTSDLEARIEKVRGGAPAGLAHPTIFEGGWIRRDISLRTASEHTGLFSLFSGLDTLLSQR